MERTSKNSIFKLILGSDLGKQDGKILQAECVPLNLGNDLAFVCEVIPQEVTEVENDLRMLRKEHEEMCKAIVDATAVTSNGEIKKINTEKFQTVFDTALDYALCRYNWGGGEEDG